MQWVSDDYTVCTCLQMCVETGVALVAEGFLSAAYHICPSSNNYQFGKPHIYKLIICN